MGVFSGEFGIVNGVKAITDWSIDETTEANAIVSSGTKGGTQRTKGINAWQGNYKMMGAKPPSMPGDVISFAGYVAPTSGVYGTDGMTATGSALITQLAITWNWATNVAMETAVTFLGSGALNWASATVITDATTESNPTPCNTSIMLDGAALADVISATFTLTKPAQSAVSSSTACRTQRKPGGAFDWTLSIVQYNESGLLGATTQGSDVIITLPANATEVWDLKWGNYTGSTGFKVDRKGTLIQHTLNFAMSGVSGGVLGWIKKPGAVAIWPPA